MATFCICSTVATAVGGKVCLVGQSDRQRHQRLDSPQKEELYTDGEKYFFLSIFTHIVHLSIKKTLARNFILIYKKIVVSLHIGSLTSIYNNY